VVGADQHEAQIRGLKMDVDVEHEIFRAAGDADRCPRLPMLHRGQRPEVVENDHDVFGFHLVEFICEHVDYV